VSRPHTWSTTRSERTPAIVQALSAASVTELDAAVDAATAVADQP